MKREKETIKVKVIPANVFSIKKGRKYILLFPQSSNIKQLSSAIKEFFGKNSPVFIIAGTKETISSTKLLEIK